MTTYAGRAHTQILDVASAEKRIRGEGDFLLDVRSTDEFAAGHVARAVCVPLPDLERRLGEIPADRPVLVMCEAGGRSAMAAERLRAWGRDNVTDVEGGFRAWHRAGLPTVRQTHAIALERQVRIAAGALVLVFSLAGFLLHPGFFWGAAFIGFMLTLTGALGICPMMSVLRLLPWNRVEGVTPAAPLVTR